MAEKKCCGTCKYNKYVRDEDEFYCGCEESDNYGIENSYDDSCECYEEKE